jgi:DNA-binding protein YbaB
MFKGLGQLGDMAKVMKQAQEMQQKMAEAQERLDSITVTGESGAGLVRATATPRACSRASISTRRSSTPMKRKWWRT